MKQGIYEISSTPMYPIGKRYAIDERAFRYALVGGVALMGGRAAANLSTAEEVTTATVASAIGTTTATIIVVSATGLVANELQGGYLCYTKTRFYRHRIKSHPAAAFGATCVLTLETAIVGHAIAAGDTLIAYHSLWRKVGYGEAYGGAVSFVGMPFGDVAVDQYTWIQTWGPVSGAPADFFGGLNSERQVWFGSDGAPTTFADPATEMTKAYQHAGFWIPCTWYSETRHDLLDGGHLWFLQIAP